MRSYQVFLSTSCLAVTLTVAACSSDPGNDCTPGEQRSCSCPGGGQGVQECSDDGSRYGDCSCAISPDAGVLDAAPPDAGSVCGDGLAAPGEICFGEPAMIEIEFPTQVIAGDFNGDDTIDLVVKSDGLSLGEQEVVLLSGIGDGTFGAPLPVSVPLGRSIAAADFDQDGASDVIVARHVDGAPMEHDFALFTGSRDGLVPGPDIAVRGTGEPGPIAVGLFNDDELPDVVMAPGSDPPGSLSVLFNEGEGSFRLSGTPSVDGSATSIMAVDLDGNGFDDIVGGTVSSQVSAFLYIMANDGEAGFREPFDSPGVSCPGSVTATCELISVAAGDLNGDEQVDIIAGSGGTPVLGVQVFLGAAAALDYSDPTGYANTFDTINNLAVVDIDRDGLMDVLTTTGFGQTVEVYRGTGDGRLELATMFSPFPVGNNLDAIAAADFDEDGSLDLVVASFTSGAISVLMSKP